MERTPFLSQPSAFEQSRPILGVQTLARGTTRLRYMGVSKYEQGIEIVSAQPYYLDEEPPLIDLNIEVSITQQEQPIFTGQELDQHFYMTVQGNRGYGQNHKQQQQQRTYQERPPLKCYKCGGNYLRRDCPYKKPPYVRNKPTGP